MTLGARRQNARAHGKQNRYDRDADQNTRACPAAFAARHGRIRMLLRVRRKPHR